MKRFILFSILALSVVFTQAQTEPKNMPASNGLAVDTVNGTGTETWTLKVPGLQKIVSVQFVATKISGTVAGSVNLQGSLNGTHWVTVTGASAYTATDVATQSTIWALDNSKYLYYRVTWTGVGTMSASARSYLLARD